jgi:asparagine synthase (glutamine-hydrolysing)
MCGISGFYIKNSLTFEKSKALISLMTSSIAHRGPDAEGFFISHDNRLALGHKRLSIIDLSEMGNQPMHSYCKNFTIVFNGEIYNFRKLKEELSDIPFKGHSDTEVLVNFISKFGFEKTLQSIKGQFAFALFNHKKRELFLVRDCIGEKPLYYYRDNNQLLFGSELSCIKANKNLSFKINHDAVTNFLKYSYIPKPMTIFEGVNKLLPGHFLRIDLNNISNKNEPQCFYDLRNNLEIKNKNLINKDEEQYYSEFEILLNEAVESQLISDAPIGGLLSGGIDSSLICSIANEKMTRKLNTFTIGFREAAFDESKYARNIASYLGTDHHELILTPSEILEEVPKIINKFDEPFADSSQIPTYLIMKHAGEHVKVVLSGDGGDELFGGYNRYLHVEKVWSLLRAVPRSIKPYIAKSLMYLPTDFLNNFNLLGVSQLGLKIEKLFSKVSSTHNKFDLYTSMLREEIGHNLSKNNESKHPLIDNNNLLPISGCFKTDMMIIDMLSYLPDDILTKVDRSSMINSIESRAPFLDRDLINFAINLPVSFKIKNSKTKFILRRSLKRRIPENLFERPKMGFSIPLSSWLKVGLHDWVHSIFENPVYFEKKILSSSFNNFLDGKLSHTLLWNIVVLESWLQKENLLRN